jgi:hypothetical protein
MRSSPPMIADELRRQADSFIELQDLANSIARAHAPHPHPVHARPAGPAEVAPAGRTL